MEHCLSCKSGTECIKCEEGFDLNNNKCSGNDREENKGLYLILKMEEKKNSKKKKNKMLCCKYCNDYWAEYKPNPESIEQSKPNNKIKYRKKYFCDYQCYNCLKYINKRKDNGNYI